MILIELNGESQLVGSLDGYDGWTVVEKELDPPPSDHCTLVDGVWVEDADAKAAADRASELGSMTRPDLVAMIEGLIADQAARVDSLQTQVDEVAATVGTATPSVA
jgi:hypothetical protein